MTRSQDRGAHCCSRTLILYVTDTQTSGDENKESGRPHRKKDVLQKKQEVDHGLCKLAYVVPFTVNLYVCVGGVGVYIACHVTKFISAPKMSL